MTEDSRKEDKTIRKNWMKQEISVEGKDWRGHEGVTRRMVSQTDKVVEL